MKELNIDFKQLGLCNRKGQSRIFNVKILCLELIFFLSRRATHTHLSRNRMTHNMLLGKLLF